MYKSYKTNNIIKCLSTCSNDEACVLAQFKSTTCYLFNVIQVQYFVQSEKSYLYKKRNNKFDRLMDSLINYWPIVNNTNDLIGNAHMYDGINASLTFDRFNNLNSALDIANGYLKLPPGIYINGNFTMSAWIYPRSINNWARIFEFGNGASNNNVYLAYTAFTTGNPALAWIYSNTPISWARFQSIGALKLNKWSHIVASFNGTHSLIFINGTIQQAEIIASPPLNVNRSFNYIGRSSYYNVNDKDANAILDELRIYNRSLGVDEIIDLMLL